MNETRNDLTLTFDEVWDLWPAVMEAVKYRRRFTWTLLLHNAILIGFDGTTVRLAFTWEGALDSFTTTGGVDVLRAAIQDALGVDWQIEAVEA
ncbi:hypothetical protein [Streptomyces sp. ME19-01-6]|uniref:hypothetical protein n=1 Tax=Streptomyces sp. ME19-01-6 TaxID=3028686 RepID=UPI0029B4E671|nr:hypothetical protein [Streptomyces sp. ME19-01-6]MDX3229394.1 hypothetical protein [Streptomyces sp. ME19-01-6]